MTSALRLLGCCVMVAVVAGCTSSDGPRTVGAVEVTTTSVSRADTDRGGTTEPPAAASSVPPVASSEMPTTSAVAVPEADLQSTAPTAPLLVDVGAVDVPVQLVGVPEGEASAVASVLFPDGFPLPAGPNVVLFLALDTVVETGYDSTTGTETAVIEVSFVGTRTIEDVRDAMAAALPVDLTDEITQFAQDDGDERSVGFIASRFADTGVRQIDVVVTELAARPAATIVRVSMIRRLSDGENRDLRPPPLVATALGSELATVAELRWRLDGYSYARSADRTIGVVSLLADLAGESRAATEQLQQTITVTSTAEQEGFTFIETPDGQWRIHHDDWPGASATFERTL